MANHRSPRRKLVQEALKKFPGKPKQTLAKWLHAQYPHEYTTVESARSSIRRYTGATGKHNLKQTPSIKIDKRKPCTLKIPRGERCIKAPLNINTSGLWLVASDPHIPYHSEVAVDACIRHAVDNKVEHLYLNGDWIDFYQASNWCRDPKKRDLHKERLVFWEILDQIIPYFPGRKIFKIGNHEDRFTRRVWQSTPELAVLPELDVESILKVKERGFEIVDSKRFVRFNGLYGFHGHELPRGLTNPVSVARGVWLRVQDKAFTSHWHSTSTHVEPGGVKKKLITTFSLGCLCDMRPEYAPINKWNHGFALLRLFGKEYQFMNRVISHNHVYAAE